MRFCFLFTMIVACGMSAGARAGSFPNQSPWTLVGIGDTQVLVQSTQGGDVFAETTQWIVDNESTRNIRFVTQLGDIVQWGKQNNTSPNNVNEWTRANTAMSNLDPAGIAWGVAVGNHELDTVDVVGSGYTAYKQYFGPTTTGRYNAMPSFKGTSTNELNTYHIYRAGGRDYLHLHLELDVPDAAITWAQQVIDQNAGLPTIVSTHVFEGTQHGPPNAPYLAGAGRNSANEIWNELIKVNEQIFMVLNGHTGQRMHQIRTNDAGEDVFTIVQDFAGFDTNNQNAGYMRLYEFDEDAGLIRVFTYSPSRDEYLTDSSNQFTLSIDFVNRFGPAVPEPSTALLVVVGAMALLRRRGMDR